MYTSSYQQYNKLTMDIVHSTTLQLSFKMHLTPPLEREDKTSSSSYRYRKMCTNEIMCM